MISGKLAVGHLGSFKLANIGAPTIPVYAASNTLTFTQSAISDNRLPLFTSSVLIINQSVSYVKDHVDTSVQQYLFFTQVVTCNLKSILSVSHSLVFSQRAYDFRNQQPVNSIIFAQQLGLQFVRNISVNQSLTFAQKAVSTGRASNTLVLSQAVGYSKVLSTRSVANSLVFSQSALGQSLFIKTGTASNNLILNQIATCSHTINRIATSILDIDQSLNKAITINQAISQQLEFESAYFRTLPLKDQNQQPVVVSIPNAQAALVPRKCTVILQTAAMAIVLPCPLLGDTDQTSDTLVIKKSMNNVTYSYIKSNDLEKLRYSFQLGRMKSLELREFILNSYGQVITLINWKGETWKVNIINNPVEMISKSRYLNEREKVIVSFDFEGTKIAG